MNFKGFSEYWAKDALPEGYFQTSQNVDRTKKGEIRVRKGLADTGLTDSANPKQGCAYFVDRLGAAYIVYIEGAGLTATQEYVAVPSPDWTN